MYIAGRSRTASNPSRALMESAVYSPFVPPLAFLGFVSLAELCSSSTISCDLIAASFTWGPHLAGFKPSKSRAEERAEPAEEAGSLSRKIVDNSGIYGLFRPPHFSISERLISSRKSALG